MRNGLVTTVALYSFALSQGIYWSYPNTYLNVTSYPYTLYSWTWHFRLKRGFQNPPPPLSNIYIGRSGFWYLSFDFWAHPYSLPITCMRALALYSFLLSQGLWVIPEYILKWTFIPIHSLLLALKYNTETRHSIAEPINNHFSSRWLTCNLHYLLVNKYFGW